MQVTGSGSTHKWTGRIGGHFSYLFFINLLICLFIAMQNFKIQKYEGRVTGSGSTHKWTGKIGGQSCYM